MYKTIDNMTHEELLQFAELIGVAPSTLALAEQVAKLPQEDLDEKGIDEWAKRLAADISKGSD